MSDADRYLQHYRRTRGAQRSGWLRQPAAYLRDRLDAKAQALSQADRFALFLPRALELCGVADTGALTVMELGAGDGWALRYARSGIERIAVDASDAFAAELAALGIAFHKRDIGREALPAADGSVALVMMNHVIEHITDPRPLLDECRRVLMRGGGLYLRTPDVLGVGHRFWEDYTHVRPYTPSSLRALALAHGFKPCATLASDHTRISLDLLTDGRYRGLLFRQSLLGLRIGGKEIEAAFRRE